jgi:hypothetical protein
MGEERDRESENGILDGRGGGNQISKRKEV